MKKQARVISNKKWQEGTFVVEIKETYKHPLYGKILNRKKKLMVNNPLKTFLDLNSIVSIKECAPVSKRKRHQIILEEVK